ncbi:MAG: radical SAM protein [Candidatus Omnitrophica bacterium]|nr:radical SAM protein [Candidatus Omnitrophota bacterium]
MRLREVLKISGHSFKRGGIQALMSLSSSYFNSYREPLKMSSGPLLIQIEPTLHCNLNCPMCINPVIERKRKHMSFAGFRMILEKAPFLRKINLVGAGEPLLNPELFQMISYARSKGILVGFATNAMLLKEDTCSKLMAALPDWVNISVDSGNKDKFEAIRKGADFDLFLENLKQLLKIKGNNRLPELSFWFVLMKDNLAELNSVILLAKNLGIKKVFSQMRHSWGSNKQFKNIPEMDLSEVKSALKDATKLARQEKVHFEYVNVPDTLGKRQCKWPWKACYITVEGFVTPCCLHGSDPNNINFGNIFIDGFRDIWNNRAYQEFRKMLKSDKPPSLCAGCTGYYNKVSV